ncbi:MAG: hypothetical protein IJG40_07870 [Oscillospiraceae bacterium]|nr:hypothetical protein [Oscillospiraceae bacterium]
MKDQIKKLTEDYISATDALLENRKFGEGVFGMPDSARSSPVHMEYYNAVEAAVNEYLSAAPQVEETDEAVRFLLMASEEYPCSNLATWMLIAIQRQALPLIPLMSDEKRAELYTWFNAHVPRLQRLPAQRDIIKALKKR